MKLTKKIKNEIRELLIDEVKKVIKGQSQLNSHKVDLYDFRVDWQNSFCYDEDIQHINNHGLKDRDYIFKRGLNELGYQKHYGKTTDLKNWYEYNWFCADVSCWNINRQCRVKIDLKQFIRNKKLKLLFN